MVRVTIFPRWTSPGSKDNGNFISTPSFALERTAYASLYELFSFYYSFLMPIAFVLWNLDIPIGIFLPEYSSVEDPVNGS